MQVLESDSASLTNEFGITVGRWAQYAASGDMPFKAMWCVVPPGDHSTVDRHPEQELFIVVRGSADVQVPGGDVRYVPPGSAALLDADEPHVLINRSAAEPLIALSVYWMPAGPGDGDAR